MVRGLWILLAAFAAVAYAHSSGCHRWHSCPSDTDSYVCGDTGHCSECPDNEYCENRVPRRGGGISSQLGALPSLSPSPSPSPDPETNPAPFVPDHGRTPGAINPGITQGNIAQTVCKPGYTETIRPPSLETEKLKAQQMRELGLPGDLQDYHEDHLVPLCAGGAPRNPRNLWPQPLEGKWQDADKNRLEQSVCRQLCRGDITLEEAQKIFLAPDWTQEYEKYFTNQRPARRTH